MWRCRPRPQPGETGRVAHGHAHPQRGSVSIIGGAAQSSRSEWLAARAGPWRASAFPLHLCISPGGQTRWRAVRHRALRAAPPPGLNGFIVHHVFAGLSPWADGLRSLRGATALRGLPFPRGRDAVRVFLYLPLVLRHSLFPLAHSLMLGLGTCYSWSDQRRSSRMVGPSVAAVMCRRMQRALTGASSARKPRPIRVPVRQVRHSSPDLYCSSKASTR